MTREDDRTDEQKRTHTVLIVGTDRWMSGWGGAEGGTSLAAWACRSEDEYSVDRWVRSRGDMSRVRLAIDAPGRPYRPKCAHLRIYVADEGHPALR